MRAAAMTAALLLSCACASMNARQAQTYLRRGRDLQSRGHPERALEQYRLAVASDPQNPQAKLALAEALGERPPQESPPEGVEAPRKSAVAAVEKPAAVEPPEERPGKPAARPLKSMLERLRLSDDAEPNNSDAFYSLGMELREAGKEKEAAVLLQRFVVLEKASPSPRQDLLKKAEEALFKMNVPLSPEPSTPSDAPLDP